MDNILINLDDNIGLSEDTLPRIGVPEDIISQSDTIVGPAGPQGPAGPAGKDGAAATITVGTTTTGSAGTNAIVQNVGTENAAILNFTIPRGNTGATGPQGIQGEQGIAGDAATITVGSVQTVAPEYPATVTNSGTTSAAVLDFEIPHGATGETGPAGADGRDGSDGAAATIAVGTVTTGAAGSSATVTNSGTSSAAVFDFTIPRGDTGATGATGATGPAGADGAAATITVGSTTTGQAGTNASVTNSGTSSAAVLDFVIPQGATGSTGPAGADGADGYSPTATVTQGTGSATITITDKNGTTTATVYDGVSPTRSAKWLTYYSSSATVVNTSTMYQLASGTIVTSGGDIAIAGSVIGTLSTGGIAYLKVKVDNNEVNVGQTNIKDTPITIGGYYVFTGISAGTHNISFGVGIQTGTNRQFSIAGYNRHSVIFLEI